MKAKIQMDIQASTLSEAHQILMEVGEKMKSKGLVSDYHFEIETPDGVVTDRCVLDNEKLIA